MFFSITTKTSNWEILTKNLVTFKRLRMKNFNDMGCSVIANNDRKFWIFSCIFSLLGA